MRDTFLIVDGNSLMHRAFHALPLMDADGVYTNAIYGFLNMLLKVIKEEDVRYIAVCFDEHGPTFRHTAYPDYKAGRSATPDELRQQFRTIRQLLTDIGVKWYTLLGWEADDLLGTLSLKAEASDVRPLLLTGDRDALQLVDGVTELMFTRKGISETILFTPAKVHEEYGFSPEQVTDWKGLAGDSSDNIPGIPGIGDKTAVKLLQKYGTLENVLASTDQEKGKLREKLETWPEQAKMCKELATIRRDAPVDFRLSDCSLPDLKNAIPALKKLRLNALVKRIASDSQNSEFGIRNSELSESAEVAAPVLLSFGEPAAIDTAEALAAWLGALTEKALPIAVYAGDVSMSIAAQDGACCVVSLGGDLLMPGLDPLEVLSQLAPVMAAHPAIVHDGKRLWHQLNRMNLPLPEEFAWDTMLGAYLINPQEKSYSFAALRGELPEDARGILSLAAWQQQKIAADQMTHLMQDVEMPLSRVLFDMEVLGFAVDTAFLRQLGDRYVAQIEEAKQGFYAACSRMAGQTVKPINLNSTQQLGDLLFDQLGLPHGKKTSKGYSTSAEVLENLRDIAPEVIDPLLRYRQLSKLNSTYIEGLLRLTGSNGRVHSTFDQVATATGRISSSEPNLQNIPVRTAEGREIRQAFLPRDGWVLLDADYSQIELRLMAHFSGDENMLDAFRTGQDIHARTASEIFEVPLSEVDGTLRSRAKAVNFGLIYGISGFGLARNTGVTQQEAKSFISRYFSKYPGVKRFMDAAVADGQENGYALTLMGRRRYLPELTAGNAMVREFGKRAAMNTPVQGTAADIIKLAMVRVHEALRREGLQSRLILQVHDELLLECPPQEADAAARLLQEAMESVITLSVPLQAEVHQGLNWAEAK
ncbi:MAG: DNA polymerase I [Clostridia bacterium]|nr:DNA polymerase I [Clostridia bacterium]